MERALLPGWGAALAQGDAALGKMEEARRRYRRFPHYWGEGDLDREQVEEARRKLVQLGGA